MRHRFPEPTGISIADLVKVARDRYGVSITPEQTRALRKGALVSENRFVIQNRETAWLAVDSLGQIWTALLPSALAFTTREAADRYVARSFSPATIERDGLTVEDVSAIESAPKHALGAA